MMGDREPLNRIDPIQIDRLVDGELSGSERRELLSRLDAEPDGWRRCALAFLEAQSWREELAVLADDSVQETVAKAPRVASRPRRRASSRLAVFNWAAAVLVAFTLGWLVGVGGDGQKPDAPDRIAERGGGASNVRELPESAPPEPSRELTPEDNGAGTEADTLGALLATVRFDDGDDGTEVQVPVYESPDLDEAWLRDQPPALPEYVRRQWERRGYRVSQQRWLYPFELDDGRQVVLPVDEVNVQYVGYEPL